MRMRTKLVLVATAILVVLPIAASTQQAPVFRSEAKIVPLYATVTDAERRLVPDLTRDDFQILDNGRPQEIVLFESEAQPITVVVMLDTSLSMALNMDFLKQGAEEFFIRLLPEDQARLGSFNDKIQFATDFTSDRDELIAGLGELGFGNPTRLYDAIDAGLDQLQGVEGRKVVLVFTDGDDTASKIGSGRVLDRARRDEVMIYAIGLESEMVVDGRRFRSRPDRGLRRLADETGGGYFELKRTSELGPTFTRVAQELHSQYVLGFTPAVLDGKVHKLEVRMTRPGLNARARRSYVASADRSSSAGF
ncbi:MAG: VWA domain-containing protein [Acidobacteria bacterium]|nr:VWA domain-containing protein [Acidobacteriota bacterium]